jgi:hypothetical protein
MCGAWQSEHRGDRVQTIEEKAIKLFLYASIRIQLANERVVIQARLIDTDRIITPNIETMFIDYVGKVVARVSPKRTRGDIKVFDVGIGAPAAQKPPEDLLSLFI